MDGVYLLNRYKVRSEWFCREELRKHYEISDGAQESILDKDLRSFLFKQEIDYPFSAPASSSGRGDIVGLLHSDDPLVLEVKIFDRNKGYGKARIIDGFTQIVRYVNDYNKPMGYLVVFNMDTAEIEIVKSQRSDRFPPKIHFSGKTFFIIFVNIPPLDTPSASKQGKLERITINEEDLTCEAGL